MRLTLKEVEAARKAVEKAKVHAKTIKTWDEAVAGINVGNQKIVAIKIKDGKVYTECEPDEAAAKPILKKGPE